MHPTEAMIADPQLQAQALVLGAEVVDAAHQIHEWPQGLRVADQGSTAPHQDRQARAEGSVQPLDEGGVELCSAVASLQQSQSCFEAAPGHAPDDTDQAFAFVALDHPTDVDVWSGDQPRTAAFST